MSDSEDSDSLVEGQAALPQTVTTAKPAQPRASQSGQAQPQQARQSRSPPPPQQPPQQNAQHVQQQQPQRQGTQPAAQGHGHGAPRPAASGPREPRGPGGRPLTAEERLVWQRQVEERRRELQKEEDELELKYGAETVLALIMPVSMCMIVVIATIRSISYFSTNDTQFVYSPYKESSSESGGQRFGGALLNVVIIIAIIVAMTFLLVVLYKYRCYRAIHGWLILSSLLLLFFFSFQYITQVLEANNQTLDYITLAMVIWNFGCVGLMVIHWKGPLLLQQAYLIAVSALMALVLIKNLPDWTTWILLAAIAIYDLAAVLCPKGPLKMLVETAQERDEPLFPALIYSSTMMWNVTMADGDSSDGNNNGRGGAPKTPQSPTSPTSTSVPASNAARVRQGAGPQASIGASLAPSSTAAATASDADAAAPAEEEEEPRSGVKLGLGDFIFYSVLVGKAATSNDWPTIFASYVAILIGLACTLLLLSIFRKALPALPISIAFGLIFFFTTGHVLSPLLEELALTQVFL